MHLKPFASMSKRLSGALTPRLTKVLQRYVNMPRSFVKPYGRSAPPSHRREHAQAHQFHKKDKP